MAQDFGTEFADVERVITDELRFKLGLGIGEEAYAAFRVGKRLQQIWDIGGVAATGGGVAASSWVAGTFFGGWLTAIGIGTAVTPIGWVLAAALASGGAYWGALRLLRGYSGERVAVIPKALNSPVDLLGAALLDLMAGLAYAVAPSGSRAIFDYFSTDWGYDPAYLARALPLVAQGAARAEPAQIAQAFARFTAQSKDCNAPHMKREMLAALQRIAGAEGRISSPQWVALGEIERAFARKRWRL